MDCKALTTVTWTAEATAIGDFAFADCVLLENFTFAATLTEIGEYAFARCAKITAPSLGFEPGENAFFGTIGA